MAAPEQRAISVKLVLLGESAVGKSSLVLRYVQDDFDEARESTIGAAFLTQRVQLEDRVIKLEIWDTAGQERYRSLSPIYYRKAAAAVVCYDITSQASLEKAKSWVRELQKQAEPSIIIALTGNKLDLEERREVKREDAERYAKEEGLLYFESSAKLGQGVAELFQELARKIPTELPKAQQPRSASGVNLDKPAQAANQEGCAC